MKSFDWREYIYIQLATMHERVKALKGYVPANAEDEYWALQQLETSLNVAVQEYAPPKGTFLTPQ